MSLYTLQIGMEWFSDRPGGLNRVYARLLHELVAIGVDVDGLVMGSDNVALESGGMVRGFAKPGTPMWERMRALRRAAAPLLREHQERSVIVSHFALYAMPVLDYLARRPSVVHFQGPWGQESLVEGASARSAAARERLEGLVYRRANAAIVLSSAFADILATRFGVARNRIHVIPGGVECERFATPASQRDCREELGWPSGRPIVLCVRRLVRRVGVDTLIDAASEIRRRVPEALILIAGKGPRRDELQARIDAKDLSATVRLVGFVPDEQLPSAYRAATCTVVPTMALEGFGLITVESLAAGTPCVVTPVDGLTEIITPLSPQLVTASSRAGDLADTLADVLLGNRPVPSSQACADYARKNYDWPVIAAQVRRVYESVL